MESTWPASQSKVFIRAAAGGADHPGSMRFIDQQKETELFLNLENLGQMANVTIHGKDAVRDDQGAVGSRSIFQLLAQR